jgi:hypothetical protein
MTAPMHTTLAGTLGRHPDGWRWQDGTPEPRVRDLRGSRHYNFRVRRTGAAGQMYVEVPLGRAREDDDLAWVLTEDYQESYDGDAVGPEDRGLDGRVRPGLRAARVRLVPIEAWERWDRETVLGAEWDRADEQAILDRARALGWVPAW